ncbi:YceI family protein [Daejeonella sp.]|uniref:YceI family protein n=1 Tax=Daejeonella sp. TaxID=2805397 RepID=UPI0030BBA18E
MKNLTISTFSIQRYAMLSIVFTVFGLSLCANKGYSQTSYKSTAGSQIKVTGTSNLHAWNMLATTFTSEGSLKVRDGELQDISSLSFSLPVTNLKSKDDLLDTRAYKALKASEFNRITFRLKGATVMPQQKIKVTGDLTIAGVTNEIIIMSTYAMNSDETITFKGAKQIKMSDHKIKAPSFMMGALKTGNEVNIEILLKLKRQNSIAQN